jgi:hypothetical protein
MSSRLARRLLVFAAIWVGWTVIGLLATGPQILAWLFRGGPPVRRGLFVYNIDWAPSFGGAARSADLGCTVGEAVETIFDPGGNLVFTGTYLTLWKKQSDGSWRYVLSS